MKSDTLPRYYADVCDNEDPEYSDYENFGKRYFIGFIGLFGFYLTLYSFGIKNVAQTFQF